jgi:hypothetical protein
MPHQMSNKLSLNFAAKVELCRRYKIEQSLAKVECCKITCRQFAIRQLKVNKKIGGQLTAYFLEKFYLPSEAGSAGVTWTG